MTALPTQDQLIGSKTTIVSTLIVSYIVVPHTLVVSTFSANKQLQQYHESIMTVVKTWELEAGDVPRNQELLPKLSLCTNEIGLHI